MSYDLFLGKTKRNLARDAEVQLPMSDEVTITFTPEESTMLTQLSTLRLQADAGDKTAKKKLALLPKKIAKLKVQARKGDLKAKRALLVLRESGILNATQTLTLGWNLFKQETPAESAARADAFAVAVNSASKTEDIAKLSQQATYDQVVKNKLGELARAGNKNALRIAAYKKESSSVVGSANSQVESLEQEIQRLRDKNPKTDADNRRLEQLSERLLRIESMSGMVNPKGKNTMASRKQELLGLLLDNSGDFAPAFAQYAWSQNQRGGRRRHHHPHHRGGQNQQQRLASLQTRAAAGDQQAAAKLQSIQSRLTTELATLNNPTAVPPTNPGAINPATGLPFTPSSILPPVNPAAYVPPNQPGVTPVAPATPVPPAPAQIQYAYQSPYYDPSTMNPYDPPPPAPTVDVYQGDSLGAEEAAALLQDGGAAERNAFKRTSHGHKSSIVGNAIPHENYRVAVMKAAVKSAGGGQPTTKDFFKAKAAVDKVIGKSGITIYMPGAKPGRRTI